MFCMGCCVGMQSDVLQCRIHLYTLFAAYLQIKTKFTLPSRDVNTLHSSPAAPSDEYNAGPGEVLTLSQTIQRSKKCG